MLASTPAGAELRVVVRSGRKGAVLSLLVRASAPQTSPATASFEDLFLTRVREQAEARHEDKSAS